MSQEKVVDGEPRSRVIFRPDLPNRLANFERACQSFGLPVHVDSPTGKRLAALRSFSAAAKPIPEDDPILPLIGESLWLSDIFEHLSDVISKKDHCRRLRSHDTFDNVYVELLAACMVKMGSGQAQLQGADVGVIVGDDCHFSIACKRVTSAQKIVARCREARDQIIEQGLPGIALVDVSPLLAVRPNWGYEEVARSTIEVIRPHLSQIQTHLVARPPLQALLFLGQFFAVTLEQDNTGKFYRGNSLAHMGKIDLLPDTNIEPLLKCLENCLKSP